MNKDPERHSIMREGHGKGNFRLGIGREATGGDIELLLRCLSQPTGQVSIKWAVPETIFPAEVRKTIVQFIENYLRGYLKIHPVGALEVTVLNGGWMEDIRNDLERASFIALHKAIIHAKLPPPL